MAGGLVALAEQLVVDEHHGSRLLRSDRGNGRSLTQRLSRAVLDRDGESRPSHNPSLLALAWTVRVFPFTLFRETVGALWSEA